MPDLHGASVNDLRVLCSVADAGSISAAAAVLGYTQSGVSRRIAALERMAGVPLLVRLPRGVRLTEEGERLRRWALDVLDAVARAERELVAATDVRRVRLGAFSTANATLVPAAIGRLATIDPLLRVTVREQRSTALVRSVASGSIDAAVVSDYPVAPPRTKGVRLATIAEDPMVVALPQRHALAGRRVSFEELASARWIEGDRAETPVLVDAAAAAGFEPDIAHRVRDWHTKLAYVAAGLGVALVPGLAATTKRAEVVFHSFPEVLPVRTLSWAYRATNTGDPDLDAVRSVVRTVAAQHRLAANP